MRVLFLNLIIVVLIVAPFGLLELARPHSPWLDEHHRSISVVIWFVTAALFYIFVFPQFELALHHGFRS